MPPHELRRNPRGPWPPGRGAGRRAAVLGATLLLALLATRDARAITPQRSEVRARLLEAIPRDSAIAYGMTSRGQVDSAHALVRPLRETADVLGEPALQARLATLDVAFDIQGGDASGALPTLHEAEARAEAARDTMTWMWSMRAESMARNYLGQHAEAERLARRWMDLAERTGSVEYQAWGHTMLGWMNSYVRGDMQAARREFETSAAQFEKIHHPIGLPYTLNLLGTTLMNLGEYQPAHDVYERVLALGLEIGNLKLQGYALGNLGTWEARFGDPAESVRLHRRAIALWKGMGDTQAQLVEISNLVAVALSLGRLDEAHALATEGVSLAESKGLGLEVPWQRSSLGDVLDASGRSEEAKGLWRSVIAMGDSVSVDPRGASAYGLASALARQDSVAAARAVVASALRMLGPNADQELLGKLGVLQAQLDDEAGDAPAAYRRARALGIHLHGDRMLELALAAWTRAAVAADHAGRTAEAAAAVDSGLAVWEEGRRVASELEFREMRGEQARALAIELLRMPGLAVSAEDGFAKRYARFERLRTRTLLERMAGARAFADSASDAIASPITDLGRFQRETLRPDEVLLEYACGHDTTALIAITRDERRIVWIPGERSLATALGLAYGLFETQPRGASATTDSVEAQLGARLFAGVEDLIASHGVVWIAPDGPLHHVPFASLRPRGSADPLIVGHRVAIVPSASVLAVLRSRGSSGNGRLLAFEGGASRTEPALPGARHEVGEIAKRFAGVRVIRAEDPRHPLTPATLAGYDALHFAAHTRIDPQAPWRSGVVLGAAADGEDSLLTAETIAASHLGSPLVVLSSCESAGGRERPGEGVAGLGSAFLAAGSPAVVATLWPVDDRTTARLMNVFYARIAGGEHPDRALRDAQLAIRNQPATSSPFYWAGFVIVGDGDRALTLRAKPFWRNLPFGGALVILLLLALLSLRRRHDNR